MKTIGKKGLAAISILAISLMFASCKEDKKDDGLALFFLLSNPPPPLCGDLTGNYVYSGEVELCGIATVRSGGSITFAAGTTVKAFPGSYILVLPGGKIFANGNAGAPVVFTSGLAEGERTPGDWGGIVIIGKASGGAAGETEGVNPQPYGLTIAAADEADSSGALVYTRIEFAGNEVAAGDELNGLSLYGVGSGTTFSYVQVHRGLDDGIEAWGGSANLDHILITGGMDDDLDFDEVYAGNVNTVVTHKYPVACGGTYSSDPRSFEMDGFFNAGADPAPGYRGGTYKATVTNFTAIGIPDSVSGSQAYRLREGFKGDFANGVFIKRSSGPGSIVANGAGSNPTTVTFNNVFAVDAASYTSSSPAPTDDADVAVTSLGDEATCDTYATAPNYTLTNSSTTGGNGSSGQWYSGWTYYKAK